LILCSFFNVFLHMYLSSAVHMWILWLIVILWILDAKMWTIIKGSFCQWFNQGYCHFISRITAIYERKGGIYSTLEMTDFQCLSCMTHILCEFMMHLCIFLLHVILILSLCCKKSKCKLLNNLKLWNHCEAKKKRYTSKAV